MAAFTNNSEMVLAIQAARGPPTEKRKTLFSQNLPPAAIISYSLYGQTNDRKRVKERFYMPPRYQQPVLINFYRPCWDAHERGPPVSRKKGPFFNCKL
ncbi:MAG: hypothetical protein DRP56_06735 [Planctomycetota bacterium]|nr:MAG: hypothetical protein DRP56_06735 [Planctomycetota bacterium]